MIYHTRSVCIMSDQTIHLSDDPEDEYSYTEVDHPETVGGDLEWSKIEDGPAVRTIRPIILN